MYSLSLCFSSLSLSLYIYIFIVLCMISSKEAFTLINGDQLAFNIVVYVRFDCCIDFSVLKGLSASSNSCM